jgi:hypothetical protein
MAAVFTEILKHAKWSELVQWSSEPALGSRGERFDAVPEYFTSGGSSRGRTSCARR